jgi:hypothetical protein
VRQLAPAFKNGPMCLFFKASPESGSKLPHSEGFGSNTFQPYRILKTSELKLGTTGSFVIQRCAIKE